MTSRETRVRFAPSPTGMLHVGNARTALYNWLFARHTGGSFLLRIEDTDVERSEARFEDQLVEDLLWLGLTWEEGPDRSGPRGPYRQSERLGIYRRHTNELLASGKAYRCFCTAQELEGDRERALAEHRAQIYSGRCRAISRDESRQRADAGQPFAVRLQLPGTPLRFQDVVRGELEFASETIGDLVLVRSADEHGEGMPVYNYVVAIDDALMDITHVIRGDDHISNTPKQVAVYEAFGWPVPEFAHLSTILGSDRERLSKRHGATSIASFREMGILPEALANYLALLGWGAEDGKSEVFSLGELAREFKLERVTPSPAIFDFDKLYWLNRHYMKALSRERLVELAKPFFKMLWSPIDHMSAQELDRMSDWFASMLMLYLPAVDTLAQLPEKASILYHFDAAQVRAQPENAQVLDEPSARKVLDAFAARAQPWQGAVTAEKFKSWMNEIKAETGVKGKELFHPVRIVLTGAHSGPEFDKLIPLMEEGSALKLSAHVLSFRERVERFFTLGQ